MCWWIFEPWIDVEALVFIDSLMMLNGDVKTTQIPLFLSKKKKFTSQFRYFLCGCRVPCNWKGGLRFSFQGNGYWLLVYVMNVGGGGDIASMSVKGSRTGWISMSHNWGASYQAFATLGGQALSFRVTSYTTKQTVVAPNVAPPNWRVGLTYASNVNFR